MKRLIATALCALAWLNLDAQVSPKDAVNFPSGYGIYYEHESRLLLSLLPHYERPQFSNIDFEKFFAKWEQWSELVAKGAVVCEYNDIFIKHFCENNPQNEHGPKYLTLPLQVKVIKYDCNINYETYPTPFADSLKTSATPESIMYFTPVIKSDKKVLYMNRELETILAGYLAEPGKDASEETDKRLKMIGEYIPTTIAHWGNGWFFLSYPNIHEIVVTNSGYYIELVDADYYGTCYFIPWDMKPSDNEPLYFGYWAQ